MVKAYDYIAKKFVIILDEFIWKWLLTTAANIPSSTIHSFSYIEIANITHFAAIQ